MNKEIINYLRLTLDVLVKNQKRYIDTASIVTAVMKSKEVKDQIKIFATPRREDGHGLDRKTSVQLATHKCTAGIRTSLSRLKGDGRIKSTKEATHMITKHGLVWHKKPAQKRSSENCVIANITKW